MSTHYPFLDKIKMLKIRDMAAILEYGRPIADRRVQVKMPAVVVDALDTLFPKEDRSLVLTRLAVAAILHHEKFSDRPELGEWQAGEQENLDTLWNYLDEREKGK